MLKSIKASSKVTFGIIIIFLSSLNLKSQNDTLNKLNINNKKQGYWIIYLNQYLDKADSINAKYYAYELFDNGVNLRPAANRVFKVNKVEIIYDSSKYTFLKVPRIDCKFIFYNKDSSEKIIEEYKKGIIYKLEVYDSHKIKKDSIARKRTAFFDFSLKYEEQIGSFYYEERFFNNDRVKKYWCRKHKGKWKMHKIKSTL